MIEIGDLILADEMLGLVEKDLGKVFSRIGKSEASMNVDRFVNFVRSRKVVEYEEAYRMIQSSFPDFREFEGVLAGALRAGYVALEQHGNKMFLVSLS